MRANFTYLYQIKSSKNYFFRIRSNIFNILCNYPRTSGHFVASLKTPLLDEAMWLSRFIKRKITEDVQMHTQTLNTIQIKALAQLSHDISSIQLELELNRFLKQSFNHWLQVGKKMIQLGVISPEALGELRTVPETTIKNVFSHGMNDEIPITVQSSTLQRFEAESARLGGSLTPHRDEALMVNRLIAEFQKLARKNEQYDPDMVSATPGIEPIEGVEFLHLLETMKRFTASFRRAERKVETKRNQHLLLSNCMQQFYDLKVAHLGASSQQQYATSFKILRDFLGSDMLVTEIDKQTVVRIQSHLQKLPSGRVIRGKPETLGVKSINKYMSNFRSFFTWLIEQMQLVSTNPFAQMSIKLKKGQHQNKRRKFKPAEIQQLLAYQPRRKNEADGFRDAANWVPAIALYSGMRLNEVAALRLRDIYKIEGVWVFDLREHQLKTDGSARIVPIHSKLIQRGLLDYWTAQKQATQLLLFPELQTEECLTARDGLGTPVSKWFNRTMLPALGIDKKMERDLSLLIDFHCCRTTVVCAFKDKGVSSYQAKAILGHVEDDITFGTYAGDENVGIDVLKRVIEMLDY